MAVLKMGSGPVRSLFKQWQVEDKPARLIIRLVLDLLRILYRLGLNLSCKYLGVALEESKRSSDLKLLGVHTEQAISVLTTFLHCRCVHSDLIWQDRDLV